MTERESNKNEVIAFSRLETCPSNLQSKCPPTQQLGLHRSAFYLRQNSFATTTLFEEYQVNAFIKRHMITAKGVQL